MTELQGQQSTCSLTAVKGGEGLSHVAACWLVIISSFGPTYSDHEMPNESAWGLLSAMVLDLMLFLARRTQCVLLLRLCTVDRASRRVSFIFYLIGGWQHIGTGSSSINAFIAKALFWNIETKP